MKITRIDRDGKRREALLKEYFLTASLIALLKRVGEEAGKATKIGGFRSSDVQHARARR